MLSKLINRIRLAQSSVAADLRMRALIYKRVRLWQGAGVVFVHVPKAAGTSISQSLYGRSVGHYSAADVKRFAPACLSNLPSFAVVRNPWSRCLSAYRFAILGGGGGDGPRVAATNPAQYQIPSFRSFSAFVEEWLAGWDVSKLDAIFQPQWPYVCDNHGNLLVDWVGRMEHLGAVEDFVRRSTGSSISLEHHNRSSSGHGKTDYRDEYDPSTREIVGRIFERDIEMFGYDF